MDNIDRFADVFRKEWRKLKDARLAYDRKVDNLAPYVGSKGYETDMESIREDYEAQCAAIHARYDEDLVLWLGAMERKVKRGDVVPPTTEQLNLLQAFAMRKDMSSDDVEAIAEVLQDNEVALESLLDIARQHGTGLGPDFKTKAMKRRDALNVITDRAKGLMAWGGGDADQTVRPYYEAREKGGARPPHTFSAAAVARIQDADQLCTYDLMRAIIADTGVNFDSVIQLG